VNLCDFFEDRVGKDTLVFLGHAEGEIGVCSEGREGGDGDVLFLTETEEVFLAQVGVHFDLEDGWLDAGISKNFAKHGGSNIGNSYPFGEAGVDEFFHGTPRVGVGNGYRLHGFASGGPAGRIHFVEGNEFERDGEVDEEEVELFKPQIVEGFFASGANMLGLVISVPEFAGDPKFVTGAQSGFDGGGDSFPDEGFIAVVGGAVEVTVSDLNCLMDDFWSEFFRDFPSAETGRR